LAGESGETEANIEGNGADKYEPKEKKRRRPFFLRHSFYLRMAQSSIFATCVYLAILGSR
jgi:hypothetical protein